MKHESLKSCVNNEKGSKIKGKIIKSSMTFNENKPNLSENKFGAKRFSTRTYEISPAPRGKKQTQFKANSNPIRFNAIFGLSSFITGKYVKFEDLAGKKQSQTNPIQTQTSLSSVCAFLFSCRGFILECRSRGGNFYQRTSSKSKNIEIFQIIIILIYTVIFHLKSTSMKKEL